MSDKILFCLLLFLGILPLIVASAIADMRRAHFIAFMAYVAGAGLSWWLGSLHALAIFSIVFFICCLLYGAVGEVVRIRARRHLASATAPSHGDFRCWCRRELKRTGWRVTIPPTSADFVIQMPGKKCHVLCYGSQEEMFQPFPRELSRLVAVSKHPIVALTYNGASPELIELFFQHGLTILDHRRIAEIGNIRLQQHN